MKILTVLGAIVFALSFCTFTNKLTERLKGGSAQQNSQTNSTTSNAANSSTTSNTEKAEKPILTDAQTAILAGGKETRWDDQGMIWTLPSNWRKMNQTKLMFNYGSPDQAFLIANISPMAQDFPAEISLTANYEAAMTRFKNGEVEKVRYLEIDGIKGVEFTETMPEDTSSPRRHQWLAFRNYAGQQQMLNVMLSTQGSNFDKHRDDFAAVLYSMKIAK